MPTLIGPLAEPDAALSGLPQALSATTASASAETAAATRRCVARPIPSSQRVPSVRHTLGPALRASYVASAHNLPGNSVGGVGLDPPNCGADGIGDHSGRSGIEQDRVV